MSRWVLRVILLPLFLLRELASQAKSVLVGTTIHRRDAYTGGPVAVIALYQNGHVRADVLGLISALRRRGVYVVALNAGKLVDCGTCLPVSVYVERPNIGRDFGSYKEGVRLVQSMSGDLSRLMFFNDSVFYVSAGLDAFLDRFLTSKSDVCSATDSAEVVQHQTSFCLSFSPRCVRHPVFQRFWKRYIPANLRPATVLFGEIALSRVLRRTGLTHDVIASRDVIRDRVTNRPDLVSGLLQNDPAVSAELADWCVSGNVTHRAPRALLEIGLPLVKLDLPHRAAKEASELSVIRESLGPEDSERLESIWSERGRSPERSSTLDRLGAFCGLA